MAVNTNINAEATAFTMVIAIPAIPSVAQLANSNGFNTVIPSTPPKTIENTNATTIINGFGNVFPVFPTIYFGNKNPASANINIIYVLIPFISTELSTATPPNSELNATRPKNSALKSNTSVKIQNTTFCFVVFMLK